MPFPSEVVKTSLSSRIAQTPTVQTLMIFSQLICRDESRLEPKFKKIYETDFEPFLISHFLSFAKT